MEFGTVLNRTLKAMDMLKHMPPETREEVYDNRTIEKCKCLVADILMDEELMRIKGCSYIVYCQDCEHRYKDEHGFWKCEFTETPAPNDWFCADGENKYRRDK